MPWVSIPGAVAAIAGSSSMVAQLIIWRNCQPLTSWVSSLVGKKSTELTRLANTGAGPALISISAVTAGTAAAVAFSPIGKIATAAFKTSWNAIMSYITNATQINWTLWGIPLKVI